MYLLRQICVGDTNTNSHNRTMQLLKLALANCPELVLRVAVFDCNLGSIHLLESSSSARHIQDCGSPFVDTHQLKHRLNLMKEHAAQLAAQIPCLTRKGGDHCQLDVLTQMLYEQCLFAPTPHLQNHFLKDTCSALVLVTIFASQGHQETKLG